jgi:hypothetical protein
MKLILIIAGPSTRKASRRRGIATAALSVLLAGGALTGSLLPLAADQGDPTGWSVLTDPRNRAFLIYVPTNGAPRLLNFACLRDVDGLSVISEGVAGNLSGAATLTLSNGSARYDMTGSVAMDTVVNLPEFNGDLADDKKAISAIAAKLLPVLQGSGPILYAIGAGSTPPDLSKNPTSIPVAGLATPLAKFKSICFGQ